MKKALVFVLLACALIYARTINVTTSNLQTALNAAVAGDTLAMAAGNYTFPTAPTQDGTLSAPIVVRGASKTTTIISGCGSGSCEGFIWTAKHWVWENVWFQGTGSNNHLFHLSPGARGYLTWRNCHFTGVADKAIKIDFAAYNGPTNVWQDYCLLENCTMVVGGGGLMNNDGGDFLTCRGNVTTGFTSGGVLYLFFSKGGLAYSIFENNICWGGDIGPLSFGGGSMGVPGVYFRHDSSFALPLSIPFKTCEMWRSVMRNNVVIGAAAGASLSNLYDCELYNNTFINCGSAVRCQNHHATGPKNFSFYNNLLVSTGAISNGTDWTIDSGNNVWTTQAPANLFVSYSAVEPGASNNYRIKSTMTGTVGTGRTPNTHASWPAFHALLSSGNYDMYGTARPASPRIGAAEAQSGSIVEMGGVQTAADLFTAEVGPNPATRSTELMLNLAKAMPLMDIGVYNVRGQHVRSVYYGPMAQGAQAVRWDGQNHDGQRMTSGTYLFRISMGREVVHKKFELVR